MTGKNEQRPKIKELSEEKIADLEGKSIKQLENAREEEIRKSKAILNQLEEDKRRTGRRVLDGRDTPERMHNELQTCYAVTWEIDRIIRKKRDAGVNEDRHRSEKDGEIGKRIASWDERFPKKDFLFRGQSDTWDLTSTLYRSLHKVGREAFLLDTEKKILTAGRYVNPPHALDAEIITDLQHFGGMTSCIDFTESIHVALYFACKDQCGTGEVLIVRRAGLPTANPAKFDAANSGETKAPIRIVSPSIRASNVDRVSDQGSVFLQVKDGRLENSKFTNIEKLNPKKKKKFMAITIKSEEKQDYLDYLEEYYLEKYWGVLQDTMGIIDKDRSFEERKINGENMLCKLEHYDNLEGEEQKWITWAMEEVGAEKAPLSSHYHLGLILYSRGCYEQAVILFHQAERQSKHMPSHLYLFLASAYIRHGKNKEAREQLAKVKDCDRGHLHSFIAADMHFKMRNYLCAWREIKRAVRLNEGSWSYLRLKIVIASKLPCASEVEKCAGQYLKNCFHDPYIAKLYENAKKGLQLHSDCGDREQ